MALVGLGSRDPATVAPTATVVEIARQMADRNVGSVVVVLDGRPVGIVTDRDLVLRVVRHGIDPARTRAREVMSRDLVTALDDIGPAQAASLMKSRRIRRLPIVDAHGDLEGIVTLDDIVRHYGRASGNVADLVASLPAPHPMT